MNYLEYLPKTTVKISNSEACLGSGVLIKLDDEYYVLTAAHVVYGEDCINIDNVDLGDLKYESEFYEELIFEEVIGLKERHKQRDLLPIKVTSTKEIDKFPDVKFSTDIGFPNAPFIFRGTANSISKETYSVDPCSINTLADKNDIFCLKIPFESYSNPQGESGKEVLQGYSGSGVFAKEADKFLLVGVVLSVSEDNFNGVNCISVNALKSEFFPSLLFDDFHGANENFKVSISEIRKEITQELINERKGEEYGDVGNLTKKMDVFLGDWDTEDLDRFLYDILVWERIEHVNFKNNSEYLGLIDDAKAILASGNKQYRVESIQKGNDRFHKIQDEFIGLVSSHLKGTPMESSARVIAAGEVAKLLAKCTLGFRFSQ